VNFTAFWHTLGPNTISGLVVGSIIALFALGYTLVYGVLRLINFAHSEVFMVGTFAAAAAWSAVGVTTNSVLPGFWGLAALIVLGLVAAVIASGGTALVVELVAYRPLRRRNAPPLAFLITAIGASLVISETFGVFTHHNQRGTARLVPVHDLLVFGDTHITVLDVLVVGLALVMMFALDRFVGRTKMGRGIRAVAQSPDNAALMGVNKDRIISLVFLLGGLMAGVAAVMYLLRVANAQYDAGFTLGIQAFTAAVLGGIGNLRGALVGGLVLGLCELYGGALFGTAWQNVVAFVVLVAVLMFRPTGILGEALGRARA
jgi:branched-chain amino acid transport system permease protein